MNSVPLWVTLIGFAAPLLTLAGSAAGYVIKLYLDARDKRRNEFYDLMKFLDINNTTAMKVTAIYELRRFPEHKDFIMRFCESQSKNVTGTGSQPLVDEMISTRDAMRAL